MAINNGVLQGAISGAQNAMAPGVSSAVQGAMTGAEINALLASGKTPSQVSAMIAQRNAQIRSGASGQPGVSTYPSAPLAGSTTALGGNGITTIGQDSAWMSASELGNSLNSLQTRNGSPYGGSGGGGGGSGGESGGSGSGTGAPGGGGALNLGSAPQGSSPGNLNQSSTPIGSTVAYQNPGSVANTNTVGYIGPGSNNSAGGQAGVLQMQQPNGQNALDQYKSTPGYQLLNAPGAYQQSPGYQYAMDQAMGQVQGQAAGRGMLESGAVLKSMQQTASGLAQQDYGNWWNRQNQLYGDYQNRLQGLAGGPTGSQDAMTAGANSAQANLQTGSNLGSLFGNQGTTGMGGIINTAAAQSGNMINAGQQQASVNAANQATQLAGATLSANQNRGLF